MGSTPGQLVLGHEQAAKTSLHPNLFIYKLRVGYVIAEGHQHFTIIAAIKK